MSKIDLRFADELKKYGAREFDACFNCGNCTAVCALSEKNTNFPRYMIRLGMLGLKKEILSSPEPWLCYACGECSDTCPRQADPGLYMAAIRRYTISSCEPTGITRLMFRSNPLFIIITLLVALILGFFLFTLKPEMVVSRWIFAWLPYAVIHSMGLVIFGFAGVSAAWGFASMAIRLSKDQPKGATQKVPVSKALGKVISEVANMKRYRDCDEGEDSFWMAKSWWQRPWFIHWSVMWGFIGLLVATSLDFLLKDPATNNWWPSRILGTIAGILMVYGATQAISYRLKKVTRIYRETTLADWTFLWFLWIAGITGFWLEIAVALGSDNPVNLSVFLIHTVISMELVLLFAFSKFAHAFYRPVALFIAFRSGNALK